MPSDGERLAGRPKPIVYLGDGYYRFDIPPVNLSKIVYQVHDGGGGFSHIPGKDGEPIVLPPSSVGP